MVLYFSATGNSEFIALEMARELNDESLNLLKRIKENDYSPINSDKPFIIVCPIYVCEPPVFLVKYLMNVKLTGNKNIYFAFTSGGYAGIAAHYGKKIARKQKMKYMGRAEFKMPRNYIASNAYALLEEDEILNRLKNTKIKLNDVISNIKNGNKLKGRHIWLFEYIVTIPFVPIWSKLKFKTKPFYYLDSCIGCGKCQNVCPLNRIKLNDLKKPVWDLENCTHCMACISNCPKEAIEYGEISLGKYRYKLKNYIGKID